MFDQEQIDKLKSNFKICGLEIVKENKSAGRYNADELPFAEQYIKDEEFKIAQQPHVEMVTEAKHANNISKISLVISILAIIVSMVSFFR